MAPVYQPRHAWCVVTAVAATARRTQHTVTLACGARQLMDRPYPPALGVRVKCRACAAKAITRVAS